MTSAHQKYKEYVKDQREFFNLLVTDNWEYHNNKFWNFVRYYEVKKVMDKIHPEKILNVGCGDGKQDVFFAEYPCVKSVVGIDYSDKSIEQANKYNTPNEKIKRRCLDFLSEDNQVPEDFDLAVSFQVIEHLSEFKKFLTKKVSKVKKGGYIVIATPNYNRLSNRLRAFFKKPKVFCDTMHFKEFTLSDLKSLAKENSLEFLDFFGHSLSFNIKYNIDKYIPKKIRFYLGVLFPNSSDCIVAIFKKL